MRAQPSSVCGFSCLFGMRLLLLIGCLLFLLPQAARADIWGYVDEQGVAHFSAERVDARYEIFFRGGESFDTSHGVPLAGDTPQPAMLPNAASRLIAIFEISPNYKQVKHHLRLLAVRAGGLSRV